MSVTSFAAAQLLRAIPRVRLSRTVGRFCDKPLPPRLSRVLQTAYVRAYGVDMSEVEPRRGAYPSFDAFFTRTLRAEARPIDDAAVVSPADGTIQATGPIDTGARIFVKGQPYDVGELVGDHGDVARYSDGAFVVVYLSPRDYHRVHSPVDGEIRRVRWIPGDLLPVNSIGQRHFPRLFVRNHRAVVPIETASLGLVTVVMVGAMIVGRITVTALSEQANPLGDHAVRPPHGVRRGDELGTFHLGSTAVVLLEPGIRIARDHGPVRYGQALTKGT